MEVVFSSLGLSDIVNVTDELEAHKLKEIKSLDLRLYYITVMSVTDAVLVTRKSVASLVGRCGVIWTRNTIVKMSPPNTL